MHRSCSDTCGGAEQIIKLRIRKAEHGGHCCDSRRIAPKRLRVGPRELRERISARGDRRLDKTEQPRTEERRARLKTRHLLRHRRRLRCAQPRRRLGGAEPVAHPCCVFALRKIWRWCTRPAERRTVALFDLEKIAC